MNSYTTLWCFGLLAICGIVCGQNATPFFAGERDNLCLGSDTNTGTCNSRRQCRLLSGVSSGQCGFASGICCTRVLGFNETSQLKRTVLRRLGTEGLANYNYGIQAANRRVCQLRIDFRRLDIAQPVVTDGQYECSAEVLTVNNIRLCGRSNNQHIYMPLSQSQNPLVTIRVALASADSLSAWEILATQLECHPGRPTSTGSQSRSETNSWSYTRQDRPEELAAAVDADDLRNSQSMPRSTIANDKFLLAPHGCLQYYPNITGEVSSFNFDADTPRYLPGLQYSICFNQPDNERLFLSFSAFQLSSRLTNAAPPAPQLDDVDNQCIWSGVQPNENRRDYLEVSRLNYGSNPTATATYFCGTILNGRNLEYNQVPYAMRFVSDNLIDAAANLEQGFRFTYRLGN